MKKFFFTPLLFLFIYTMPIKKTRVIFFGDSITAAAINKDGYIDRIQASLGGIGVAKDYDLVGAGVSGNKVYDLYLRMEEDVLDKKPDIVVIYIGINDVWHKTSYGTGTDKDKYQKFYAAIIRRLQAKKIKVAVCTPTVIGELKNGTNPQDADLDSYSEIIRGLAAAHKCTLIDLRNAFIKYENSNNKDNKESGVLTTDRVHLNEAGNRLVAGEMMQHLFRVAGE
jgi:lysophospholipase L1-like esterase